MLASALPRLPGLCGLVAAADNALAARLASSSNASCSGLRDCQTSAAAADAPAKANLTPEQLKYLPVLLHTLQRPAANASKLAMTTALAATYRDLYVAMDSLYLREVHKHRYPLYYIPTQASGQVASEQQAATPDASSSSPPHVTQFPIRDVTKLPDSDVPAGLHLDEKYMDKITCWMQLLPNHMEMSYQLLTSVKLFPPMEASYPTYIDFDAAVRSMEHRKSRKRVQFQKKLLKKQDKYQIKTWDHYPGEA